MTRIARSEWDALVGSRLRERRLEVGLSQVALAKHLGITFQQVQKYETGHNRMTANRLAEAAKVLGVTVGYFFGEDPALAKADEVIALLGTPGAIGLLRAFALVESGARKSVVNIVSALATASPPSAPPLTEEK